MTEPTSAVRVSFRRGGAHDAPRVAALAIQVFLDTYANSGISPELAREAFSKYSRERFGDRLADERRHFVLAERGEHLLGFAELAQQRSRPTSDGPDGLELVRLYVLPAFQRRAVGRTLLAEAEARARELKAAGLWLTAWSGNQRALAFYRSRGYHDAGTAYHEIEGKSYENRILLKQLVDEATISM